MSSSEGSTTGTGSGSDGSGEGAEALNCTEMTEELEKSRAAREERRAIMRREEPVAGPSSACDNASVNDHPRGMKLRSGKVMEEAAGSGKGGRSTGHAEESTSASSTLLKELHPLFNPVILTNFFQVCPHEILSNCRLVCKTWYLDSLLAWRSTSTIAFNYSRNKNHIYLAIREDAEHDVLVDSSGTESDSGSDYDDYAEFQKYKFGRNGRISLPQFLDFSKRECSVKPYRQYHLNNFSFATLSNSIREQLERFWTVEGRNVTLLKLSNCKFEDAAGFRRIIFQTCPNLKTLILDKCIFLSRMPQPETGPSSYLEPTCGEQVNLKSFSLIKNCELYWWNEWRNVGDDDDNQDEEDGQEDDDDQDTDSDPDDDDDYDEGGGNAVVRIRNFPTPISYLELLSHFPSLTYLNICLGDLFHLDDLLWLLQAIKVIRQRDQRKLPIKKFHLGSEGFVLMEGVDPVKSNQIFSLFQELNLDLEYLVIYFTTDVHVLKDLLTLIGSTIRTIKADGDTASSVPPPRFPRSSYGFPCRFPFGVELTNLRTLILSSAFTSNMDFLKWTPNLEKLQLTPKEDQLHGPCVNTNVISNTRETNMGDVRLAKLKELFLGYDVTPDDVSKLCKWMPNVEILFMFLADEQFPIICTFWKKLTHIHQLGGDQLHDEAVTGMGWGRQQEEEKNIPRQPNITMLKELCCFQYVLPTSLLTDLSVYNGFLKLPKLHILAISTHTSQLISDEAVQALQEKIPNCQVKNRATKNPRGAWSSSANSGTRDECKYLTAAKGRYVSDW